MKELREIGIQPDILLCRTDRTLAPEVKGKIALFCNVDKDAVIAAKNAETIYEVPINFHEERLDEKIVEKLNIWTGRPDLKGWERVVKKIKQPHRETTIAVVGKYVGLVESYKSLTEALIHGGIANDARVQLRYVDSEQVEKEGPGSLLKEANGILVPGGFGTRGIEGKIRAIQYAREKRIPFFGICLGMQCAVIEAARHCAGLKGANSTEFGIDVVDRALDWAEACGLKVVLDLHAAPGCQNGFDNGGIKDVCEWDTRGEYLAHSVELLGRLAQRYRAAPALYGIEVLNEPRWDVPTALLEQYYRRSYAAIRAHCPAERLAVVFHDGSRSHHEFVSLFRAAGFENALFDVHRYQCFAREDLDLDIHGHVHKAGVSWGEEADAVQRELGVPAIAGEWSLGASTRTPSS